MTIEKRLIQLKTYFTTLEYIEAYEKNMIVHCEAVATNVADILQELKGIDIEDMTQAEHVIYHIILGKRRTKTDQNKRNSVAIADGDTLPKEDDDV